MSDILSQAEIDELLNAMSSGSEPAEAPPVEEDVSSKAKPYDFKTANRFPKEQIRTFNVIYQTFAQLFSNKLSAILHATCECEVLSIEEVSFNEFNNSMPVPVILAVFKSPPIQGSMLLEISPEIAYMIISRLFGGNQGGESSKLFTEIELALIERILRSSCSVFDEAWAKMIEMNTQVERLETSPQFAQIVALNEPVAVIGLNLKIGDESGIISICIPHTAIEPIAKQLNTRMLYTNASTDSSIKVESKAEIITEKLEHTPVSLITYFDTTLATVADIVNLQVGDVIRLNHRTEDPVTINVEHIPKFLAKIGSQNGYYALQVDNIIREEEQEAISERINSAVFG